MDFTFCPKCATRLVPRETEPGRSRPVCPKDGCGYVHYDNPVPVVAGIVERGDEILLVRNKGWPANWFGLVTGFLERDESPEEGILREIDEELGLTGEVRELVGNYPFPQMNQVILAYHVVAEGEVRLGDELEAFKPVPIGELKPWGFGTGHAVRDFLARVRTGR